MKTTPAEVGRMLKASEIIPGRIYVIRPPGTSSMFITMWAEQVRDGLISFYSGVASWHVVNRIVGDEILDDRNRLVHVYEYLGTDQVALKGIRDVEP